MADGVKRKKNKPRTPDAAQMAELKRRKRMRASHIKDAQQNDNKDAQQNDNNETQTPVATSEDHFPFLKLPPELRNNIYEKVFDELPKIYVTPGNRVVLASQSALLRVSRQIRNEFVMTYIYAREVVFQVRNFNFGPAITCLNKLSNVEPSITVELSFDRFPQSDEPCGKPKSFLPTLTRWINRLDHPRKRGSKIDASYVCKPMKWVGLLGPLMKAVNRVADAYGDETKKYDEAMKVWDALPTAETL